MVQSFQRKGLREARMKDTEGMVWVYKRVMENIEKFETHHIIGCRKLIEQVAACEWPGGFLSTKFNEKHEFEILHKDGTYRVIEGIEENWNYPEPEDLNYDGGAKHEDQNR